MARLLILLSAAVVVPLFFPDQALAWGPGVHLAVGGRLLAESALLVQGAASLINRYPILFLYGSLSADIFIGKGVKARPGHSHNWETGLKLLDRAYSPELQAYAYGYLCHLAADVAAHNYYVPNLMGGLKLRNNASHVYLEMRADMLAGSRSGLAREVFKPGRSGALRADKVLISAMNGRRLPFMLKKEVFRRSLYFSSRKFTRVMLERSGSMFRPVGEKSGLARMIELSAALCRDVLNDPRGSRVTNFDPIGSRNLGLARKMGGPAKRLFPARNARRPAYFPVDKRLASLARKGKGKVNGASGGRGE